MSCSLDSGQKKLIIAQASRASSGFRTDRNTDLALFSKVNTNPVRRGPGCRETGAAHVAGRKTEEPKHYSAMPQCKQNFRKEFGDFWKYSGNNRRSSTGAWVSKLYLSVPSCSARPEQE